MRVDKTVIVESQILCHAAYYLVLLQTSDLPLISDISFFFFFFFPLHETRRDAKSLVDLGV